MCEPNHTGSHSCEHSLHPHNVIAGLCLATGHSIYLNGHLVLFLSLSGYIYVFELSLICSLINNQKQSTLKWRFDIRVSFDSALIILAMIYYLRHVYLLACQKYKVEKVNSLVQTKFKSSFRHR